jgi:hypothetical protein
MSKLKMMDWISLAIFFGGTTCFTMAVNFGGTVYAFDSGSEIALWVMTGVLLIAIVLTTIYHPGVTKENRMYPAHFLRRHVLVNLQLQLFLVSGVMLVSLVPTNIPRKLLTFKDNCVLYPTILPVHQRR